MTFSAKKSRLPHHTPRMLIALSLFVIGVTPIISIAGSADLPPGDTCGNPIAIDAGTIGIFEANIGDYDNDYVSLCTINRFGPDIVFQANLTSSDTLSFTFENLDDVASSFEIWIVVGCTACIYTGSGSGTPGEPETWRYSSASGPYQIIIDADDPAADIQFRVSWIVTPNSSPVESVSWGMIKSIYND